MKALETFAVALATAALAFSQTEPRPQFEVASVKVSAPITSEGQLNVGVHIDGAMVRCNYLSLRNYLTVAYDVKDYQIFGPDWLATEHYDIVAKFPDGGAKDEKTLRAMVASLLADRFKLTLHHETRDLPAFALVVGKNGFKLKEVPPEADAGDGKVDVDVTGGGRGGTTVNLGNGSYLTYSLNQLEAKKITIAMALDSLSKLVDRPIVDQTGLTGRYDMTLPYSIQELRNLVRASGSDASRIPDIPGDPTVSIFTSLEDAGLKLEARKAPMDVIVIDRAEKTPTAN